MRNLVGAVSDYKDQGGNPGLLMTSSSTTNRKLRGFMISSDFFHYCHDRSELFFSTLYITVFSRLFSLFL